MERVDRRIESLEKALKRLDESLLSFWGKNKSILCEITADQIRDSVIKRYDTREKINRNRKRILTQPKLRYRT